MNTDENPKIVQAREEAMNYLKTCAMVDQIKAYPKNIEFYQDNEGHWRWGLKADNGERIAASTEGYVKRRDALKNLLQVGKSIAGSELYNLHVIDKEKYGGL